MCMCTKQDTYFGHLRPFKPPWMFDVWGSWGSRFWFQVHPPEIADVPGLAGLKLRAVRNVSLCHFGSQGLKAPPKILEVGIWVDHGDSFKAMCQGLLQGLFDGQAGACGAGPWTSMKNPLYFPSCSILALLSGWWRWFGFFLFSPKCWDGGCWWFVFFYFPQPDWDDDPIWLINIFQGWNHQPVIIIDPKWCWLYDIICPLVIKHGNGQSSVYRWFTVPIKTFIYRTCAIATFGGAKVLPLRCWMAQPFKAAGFGSLAKTGPEWSECSNFILPDIFLIRSWSSRVQES